MLKHGPSQRDDIPPSRKSGFARLATRTDLVFELLVEVETWPSWNYFIDASPARRLVHIGQEFRVGVAGVELQGTVVGLCPNTFVRWQAGYPGHSGPVVEQAFGLLQESTDQCLLMIDCWSKWGGKDENLDADLQGLLLGLFRKSQAQLAPTALNRSDFS